MPAPGKNPAHDFIQTLRWKFQFYYSIWKRFYFLMLMPLPLHDQVGRLTPENQYDLEWLMITRETNECIAEFFFGVERN